MRSFTKQLAYIVCSIYLVFTVGCEAPPAEGLANNLMAAQSPNETTLLNVGASCELVEGAVNEYEVAADCIADVGFRPAAEHGEYLITLNANAPLKFRPNSEAISPDAQTLSWTMKLFSGGETVRQVAFTFYPENAPDRLTMNGVYGIEACAKHTSTDETHCTPLKIDRPDRTWQEVNADWSTGQTELDYYFAPINAVESWLFVQLTSTMNDFEPEVTVELQDGLRINSESAMKPYYLQVGEGGRSAEILPRHLGKMFKDDTRIMVLHVIHDGVTEGKMPARVTVRSEGRSFWEDSTMRLTTNKNADGTLQIAAQENPNAAIGQAPPRNATVTPDPQATASLLERGLETPVNPYPVNSLTPTPIVITPLPVTPPVSTPTPHCTNCKQAAPTNVEWTRIFIAPYTMHRYDAYTKHLPTELRSHLTWRQFKYWILVHNPKLNWRYPIFYAGQTYYFPTLINSSSR